MSIAITQELSRALMEEREREARAARRVAAARAGEHPLRSWLAARLIDLGLLVDCAAGRRALRTANESAGC